MAHNPGLLVVAGLFVVASKFKKPFQQVSMRGLHVNSAQKTKWYFDARLKVSAERENS